MKDLTLFTRIHDSNGQRYLAIADNDVVFTTEKDFVDLIGLCGEQNADRLLLDASNLPDSFFDLKSGLAGMILQKFMNYHLTVAIVVPPERIGGRFREMALEASRGGHFRIFQEKKAAEDWLLRA